MASLPEDLKRGTPSANKIKPACSGSIKNPPFCIFSHLEYHGACPVALVNGYCSSAQFSARKYVVIRKGILNEKPSLFLTTKNVF